MNIREEKEMVFVPQPRIFVDFYGGPFSNFVGTPFVLDDLWREDKRFLYRTVEHYFQAAKATNVEEHDWVAYSNSPSLAKKRGRTIGLRPDWEEVKYDVMLIGLRAKFLDPKYSKFLLDTGDAIIREDSPTDFEWGYRNNGKNLLGKALMQIREELRSG